MGRVAGQGRSVPPRRLTVLISSMDATLRWLTNCCGLPGPSDFRWMKRKRFSRSGALPPRSMPTGKRAGELRITAVPTHLCGTKRLAGFGPYDDFVHLIGEE